MNELNELQTSKHITTEFILIVFLIIAEGFGYKNWALLEPELQREESNSPSVYPLNFFVVTLIVFGIGCLEYAVINLIHLKFPPGYLDFIDLCSVANISCIFFNADLQGYYIHGKSPSGSADISSEKLRLNLLQEENGNSTFRGISASMPDSQTFSIMMPKKMIDDYKGNYLMKVN